jgi:Tat protein secretion system quality control protein TatD with DNase activity
MQVYDTHCHIGLDGKVAPEHDHDNARAAGVDALLVVGIDAATSRAARELTRLPGVRWSAGLHPNDATRFDDEWPQIVELARDDHATAYSTIMPCSASFLSTNGFWARHSLAAPS